MITLSSLELDPHSGLQLRRAGNLTAPQGRLLLLHGVGSNEENLAPLVSKLPPQLEILLVRAPRQLGPGGYGFYQVSFATGKPTFEVDHAEKSRLQLIALLEGLPPLPTVIAGFSQGGIMSAGVGLSAPQHLRGFALLSGRMLEEFAPSIAPAIALEGLQAFVAHGHRDGVLPVAYARQSQAWLERLGVAHVLRLYDMAHEISDAELSDFSQWVRSVLNVKG
ncbi:alpha/beta hydrolase [Pseudomonas sp. Marseille-P9899]|uniref:alpha/beta hydrolase n=1 Tax=Pseudomonas sp. Marseille-P9899 TaxID=2730401 RepID=UPI00158EC7A6|nr:phospholipase [Pseudomonas sp. Marseille-P9899]